MSELVIRPVRPEDAARIAEIYRYYVEETTISFEEVAPDAVQMRRRIEDFTRSCPYFVCEVDGTIQGYCYAHLWKERPAYRNTLETTVYLTHGLSGRGIGRALMLRLIDDAFSRGYHALIACITADNEGSIAFHRSLGFKEVARYRQVGNKFGRWLDVVDLELINPNV